MGNEENDFLVYPACLTDLSILQRRIKLKGQALKIIRAERNELRQRLSLLRMRESLLEQMGPDFDPEVSRKLDCVDFLLLRAR
jgi:hypothetical protein